MTRKYLLIASIILELILYYTIPNKTYTLFRVVSHIIVFQWLYQSLKPNFTKTDILILIHTFIPIISPILHLFSNKKSGTIFELIVISFGHIALIAAFLIKNNRIQFKFTEKIFYQVLIPYIIVPILFFYLALSPLPKSISPFVLVYSTILILMAVLSAYYSKDQKVSLCVMCGVALVLFASGANGYRLFVTPYFMDFAFVRIATILSKYFISLGFIINKRIEQ